MSVPSHAKAIQALAEENEWVVAVEAEDLPITLEYEDGSEREVETPTYQMSGVYEDDSDVMFVIGWAINPFTDRWNLRVHNVMLVTGDKFEKTLANVMDLLPRYVYWELPLKTIKYVIGSHDPKDLLEGWNSND
jgi:hypothetical protein